jgi:hypothetical protein
VDNLKRTPLHHAAWFGQKYTTEALLRNNAQVTARDVQVRERESLMRNLPNR